MFRKVHTGWRHTQSIWQNRAALLRACEDYGPSAVLGNLRDLVHFFRSAGRPYADRLASDLAWLTKYLKYEHRFVEPAWRPPSEPKAKQAVKKNPRQSAVPDEGHNA